MARKRDRLFALTMALLFFVTAFGFSFWVIWALAHQNNKSSNSTSSNQTSSNNAKTTPSAMLTGTKMSGFTPLKNVTKLEIIDLKKGTGATVQPGATITADYVGALASTGVIFDASADHGGPQTFSLQSVIAGWSQGVPGMKVGGERELLIPSALGYGSQAQTGIPANSNLVFTITVTKID